MRGPLTVIGQCDDELDILLLSQSNKLIEALKTCWAIVYKQWTSAAADRLTEVKYDALYVAFPSAHSWNQMGPESFE